MTRSTLLLFGLSVLLASPSRAAPKKPKPSPGTEAVPPKGITSPDQVKPTDDLASQPAPTTVTSAPADVGSVTEAFDLPATSEVRRYAMRQIVTSDIRNPSPFSSAEWLPTTTTMWAIVEWFQEDQEVWYTEKMCAIQTAKVFGTRTEYPQAFLDSVPIRERKATMSGMGRGAMFMTQPYAQTLGIEMAEPFRDAMPESEDDPRIRDTDGDGHAGVTVQISHPMVGTGQVYMAQRSVARLEGFQEKRGRIRGVMYTKSDNFRLGASRWWLMGDTPQRPHPDPSKSPFVLVPAPYDLECAGLMADLDTYFGEEA
jgi:hypothetical protein